MRNQETVEEQTDDLDRLRQLAEKHTLHYKVYPEYSLVDGAAAKVDFELDLCGSHDHSSYVVVPFTVQSDFQGGVRSEVGWEGMVEHFVFAPAEHSLRARAPHPYPAVGI